MTQTWKIMTVHNSYISYHEVYNTLHLHRRFKIFLLFEADKKSCLKFLTNNKAPYLSHEETQGTICCLSLSLTGAHHMPTLGTEAKCCISSYQNAHHCSLSNPQDNAWDRPPIHEIQLRKEWQTRSPSCDTGGHGIFSGGRSWRVKEKSSICSLTTRGPILHRCWNSSK